ncbi:MAG TPA: diaminopimelate epimerase [Pseudomonadales bacterium]|nr:diaminopimelate epimerase [Pseudomonadales bacterium]
MLLHFTKMHGLGNDFVVLDLITQSLQPDASLIRLLADRRRGIGCEQVLVVEPPGNPEMDFRYRIFDHGGSEVREGGNGARCIARFIRDHRLSAKRRLRLETLAGPLGVAAGKGSLVTASLGVPRLEPQEIPFRAGQRAASYTLEACGRQWQIGAVAVGTPHAVLLVDEVNSVPVETLAPALESHPDFSEGSSVGFMQVLDRDEIRLRVFERGTGEVQACDNGAGAAVVAGRLRGVLGEHVRVNLPGGFLRVEWRGEGEALLVTGPTTTVFEGQITV